MSKSKQKNIRVTPEQWELLEQNPEALKLGLKTALELSVGCVLASKECYTIKGLDYDIMIFTDDEIVVLKTKELTKAVPFKDITVGDFGKLQTFAKQNPTYSQNLVYKFKSLLENGN